MEQEVPQRKIDHPIFQEIVLGQQDDVVNPVEKLEFLYGHFDNFTDSFFIDASKCGIAFQPKFFNWKWRFL